MSARDDMLARIRTALDGTPGVPEVTRGYRRADATTTGSPVIVERFCERAAEYRATVTRASAAGLESAVAAVCRARGTRRIVAAQEMRLEPPDVEVVDDTPAIDPAQLDAFPTALTGCALAIAETGTIVLDGGPASGRRALTLVPDHHICVVRAGQVVADVPGAIAALGPAAAQGRPLTFVSGPSATSDIELERVEGVHGPRVLDIVVVS